MVKVCCVQLAPLHKNVKGSMKKAEEILDPIYEKYGKEIGIIVLPEMAFTGYQFKDAQDIIEVTERMGEGPTFAWAKDMAQKFEAFVCVGYARRGDDDSELYNSMMVLNPNGELVKNYDKTHLYATDKTWACEGTGFATVQLQGLKKKDGKPILAGLGICMDINPYEFQAPWTDFELASFHEREKVDFILFSSAWCNRHPNDEEEGEIDGERTMNYWAARLEPLLKKRATYFIVANRVGSEPMSFMNEGQSGKTTFVGSSCVIDLGRVKYVGYLDTSEESGLVCDIDV